MIELGFSQKFIHYSKQQLTEKNYPISGKIANMPAIKSLSDFLLKKGIYNEGLIINYNMQ